MLNDLIGKLPEELQPSAKKYAGAIVDMGVEDIKSWSQMIADQDWVSAYTTLAARMNTEDLIEAQREFNREFEMLNGRNAKLIELNKMIVTDAVKVGLSLLKVNV